jgi:hypothetical protein
MAIAARFVFPAYSLEGSTLWLIRSSPLPPETFVWSKYWAGAVPLLVLALVLTFVTNRILGVQTGIMALSLVTIACLTLAFVAQALAWGIAMPKFETGNAAQIPTSLGGMLFMLGALASLAVVLGAQLWLLRGYMLGRRARRPALAAARLHAERTARTCVARPHLVGDRLRSPGDGRAHGRAHRSPLPLRAATGKRRLTLISAEGPSTEGRRRRLLPRTSSHQGFPSRTGC